MKRKTDTRVALVPERAAAKGAAKVRRYRIARVATLPPERRLSPVRA